MMDKDRIYFRNLPETITPEIYAKWRNIGIG